MLQGYANILSVHTHVAALHVTFRQTASVQSMVQCRFLPADDPTQLTGLRYRGMPSMVS